MSVASKTHLVLIPSYNPGLQVVEVVSAVRAHWSPVWVVVDGSDDGSAEALDALAARDPELRVLHMDRNRGKGAAVLHGLELALESGFSHVLAMDSDGQHPVKSISEFMAASAAFPTAMVLGDPQFDSSAPNIRVKGRR